ncbi:MAG: lysylphosphatidylglycerol synthase transmembrane domain-containing protein, partial [Bacteroidota bacterium]
MDKKRRKKIIQNTVKLLITGVALYYVFQKVDREELLNSIVQTKIAYYLLAILAFNASKIASAFRVLEFYRAIGIYLSRLFNLKLSYVGMFYNLFLPGSIGGDGYKVYLLKQGNNQVKTKLLVAATLLDRLSGLAILFLLGGVFFLLSSFDAALFY